MSHLLKKTRRTVSRVASKVLHGVKSVRVAYALGFVSGLAAAAGSGEAEIVGIALRAKQAYEE